MHAYAKMKDMLTISKYDDCYADKSLGCDDVASANPNIEIRLEIIIEFMLLSSFSLSLSLDYCCCYMNLAFNSKEAIW
jgi:hypothetical protein